MQIIIKGDAAAIQSRDDYNPYTIWSVQLERFLNYQKADYSNLHSKGQGVAIKGCYLVEVQNKNLLFQKDAS